MLVLKRTKEIDDNTLVLEVPGYPPIRVRILRAKGKVQVGVDAPKDCKILREEIIERKEAA
jgi:sRNA-binding carbon storage regulator CsrA